MRGTNVCCVSGNVGAAITHGETGSGEPACGFLLCSDKHIGAGKVISTWVKINCFAWLANLCRTKLQKGMYCEVTGELMTRSGNHGDLLEVRAKDIVFHPYVAKAKDPVYQEELYEKEDEHEQEDE